MNPNLPNNLNPLATPRTTIYRPRYRSKLASPTYSLENASSVRETDTSGLLNPFEALEAWRTDQEHRIENTAVRWHPEKLQQLAIYITPPPNDQWHLILQAACHEWEAASLGLVHFYLTVRPDQADIIIDWVSAATKGREYEVGHTRRTTHPPHWIKQVHISLLMTPEIDKQLLPKQIQRRLYTTMLHEVGHALGLEHSRNKRDIMFHQGWRNTRLTAHDIESLKNLYSRPASSISVL